MDSVDFTKTHHSICSCTSSEHTVHWHYSPPYKITGKNIPKEVDFQHPGEVYFDVCVSWNQSFFKRCWNAARYVFGHRSVYGHFDCFVLEKHEARKLMAFLQQYTNEPDEIRPVPPGE